MVKKFLVGTLAAVLMVEGAVATTATADAAKLPKAKYTYNFNKADSNVVAVTRKGDGSDGTTGGAAVVPKKDSSKKVTLKKGKNGKALYLDRTYGVQLKNMKLKSSKYTISFWVKSDSDMSNYMTTFFAGSNFTNDSTVKWISITKTDWVGDSSPIVWSHNEGKSQFPWTGPWAGEANNAISKANGWTHITVVVGGTYKDSKNDINQGATSGYLEDSSETYYQKSGNNVVSYVNGKFYGTGTCAADDIMDGKESAFLGINCWDILFKGYFDDVQIYDKALTSAQVKQLYKSVGGK
jgi:hypothetical protein